MENKINIAELLKDCPKGMELDCTIYEGAELDCVTDDKNYPIKIIIKDDINGNIGISLTKEGYYNMYHNPKCVIFPKGKTTWEGFQRPFKDGDIIFTHANCLKVGVGNTWISIFQEKRNGGVATYVDYAEDGSEIYLYDEDKSLLCMKEDILRQRLATEEEKEKLFKAIKDNGYKWNAETKTLEKLIEPKFKVGDRIKNKRNNSLGTIVLIDENFYHCAFSVIPICEQDEYELVPNKFDITTLVPFESKVLIRDHKSQKWNPAIWGFYDTDPYFPYRLIGTISHCCIPYEGNEHLLGITKDCDEYYKTWE